MVKLAIIFPFDPLGSKVGGAESFISDVVKFCPPDIEIEFIGVSSDKDMRQAGVWQSINIGSKDFRFLALFFEKDENKRKLIPLSLKFALSLKAANINFSNRVLLFNRIEPALFLGNAGFSRIGIIHNDIGSQVIAGKGEALWGKFPALYFLAEKIIFKSFEHIYVVSQDTLEFYKNKYNKYKGRFSFISTWVDTGIFNNTAESKASIKKGLAKKEGFLPFDKKWILYVGRLQDQKCPLRMIDTFYEYNKNNRGACLIIIGDGNLKEKTLKHAQELNIQDSVFFLGNMHKESLVPFYRAADVFLLASNFEGMPMAVLEALACGLPVVSTDVGEVKRVIKEGVCGEVVKTFSPVDLSAQVKRILDDADNKYSLDNCKSSIMEYTPGKVLASFYKHIKDLWYRDYRHHRYVNILGLRYDNLKLHDALEQATKLFTSGKKAEIYFINIDCLYRAQRDKDYHDILIGASLVLPDGVGLGLLTKIYGRKMIENCNGSLFCPLFMAKLQKLGARIFLLGGVEAEAEKVAQVLCRRIPGINIVGTHSGYFNNSYAVIKKINDSRADVLFVGMGVPLQEEWISKHREQLFPTLCLGVGALFDYLSAKVMRAPRILQILNLEWIWRIAMEPKRLWRRYLVDDVKFFLMVLRKKAGF